MNEIVGQAVSGVGDQLIGFTRQLVRLKTEPGREGSAIELIKDRMCSLGYDDVIIDGFGNITGIVGFGPRKLLYSAHVDAPEVSPGEKWGFHPYDGNILNGRIFGKGVVSAKASAASAVFAGSVIKSIGLDKGRTVYITVASLEEACEGESLGCILSRNGIKPDAAVICQPSSLEITTGGHGRALIKVSINGKSAHGSFTKIGDNAIHKMQHVINRVATKSAALQKTSMPSGSISITRVESNAPSLSGIPVECCIYIDRRLESYQDIDYIAAEMDALLENTDASWDLCEVRQMSYSGEMVVLTPLQDAWETPRDCDFVLAAEKASRALFGDKTRIVDRGYTVNGSATANKGIPTIGFGPGNSSLIYSADESCPTDEIVKACEFYSLLPHYI